MLYIIFICILQKIDYSFPIPGNGAYCEFCCHILKLFSCSEEMKIIFFVFLALLVSVQSKPFTESTESVSSRNYFHFTIKKLATREDSTGLCTVRKELQAKENLNEGRKLIKYLDQVGSDIFGFDPSSCSVTSDILTDTESDPQSIFKDEEMPKNEAVQFDVLSQEFENKTLQTVGDIYAKSENNQIDDGFNLEPADIQEIVSCDDCQNNDVEGEMSFILNDSEQLNGERVKLAVILVAVTFLVIILLVIIAFAITMCWKP